jgi:hypothetical protein
MTPSRSSDTPRSLRSVSVASPVSSLVLPLNDVGRRGIFLNVSTSAQSAVGGAAWLAVIAQRRWDLSLTTEMLGHLRGQSVRVLLARFTAGRLVAHSWPGAGLWLRRCWPVVHRPRSRRPSRGESVHPDAPARRRAASAHLGVLEETGGDESSLGSLDSRGGVKDKSCEPGHPEAVAKGAVGLCQLGHPGEDAPHGATGDTGHVGEWDCLGSLAKRGAHKTPRKGRMTTRATWTTINVAPWEELARRRPGGAGVLMYGVVRRARPCG